MCTSAASLIPATPSPSLMAWASLAAAQVSSLSAPRRPRITTGSLCRLQTWYDCYGTVSEDAPKKYHSSPRSPLQVSLSLLMIEDCTGRGINVTYEFVERRAASRLLMDSNTFSLFTASAAGIIAVLLYANDIFQIL